MKTMIAIIVSLLLGAILAIICYPPNTNANAKFVTTEIVKPDPMLDYLTQRWLKKVGSNLPNEQWARDEVRKNTSISLNHYRSVVRNPHKMYVSKTSDTKTYVIEIVALNGERTSLWLNEDGLVESVD